METAIRTRIVQKHAIESVWLQSTMVPKQGELIIYDSEIDNDGKTLALPQGRTTPYTYARFKIGDGITNVNDLPFTVETIKAEVKAYVEEVILNGEW